MLPTSIAELGALEILALDRAHRDYLLVSLPASFPHAICQEHSELKRAISKDESLKATLKALADKTSSSDGFNECWDPLGDKFPHLRMFACGLAVIFPGNSSVESDFSIINCRKSDFRSCLADLSV